MARRLPRLTIESLDVLCEVLTPGAFPTDAGLRANHREGTTSDWEFDLRTADGPSSRCEAVFPKKGIGLGRRALSLLLASCWSRATGKALHQEALLDTPGWDGLRKPRAQRKKLTQYAKARVWSIDSEGIVRASRSVDLRFRGVSAEELDHATVEEVTVWLGFCEVGDSDAAENPEVSPPPGEEAPDENAPAENDAPETRSAPRRIVWLGVALSVLILAVVLVAYGSMGEEETAAPETVSITLAADEQQGAWVLSPVRGLVDPPLPEFPRTRGLVPIEGNEIVGGIVTISDRLVAVFPRRPDDLESLREASAFELIDLEHPPAPVREAGWGFGFIVRRMPPITVHMNVAPNPGSWSFAEVYSIPRGLDGPARRLDIIILDYIYDPNTGYPPPRDVRELFVPMHAWSLLSCNEAAIDQMTDAPTSTWVVTRGDIMSPDVTPLWEFVHRPHIRERCRSYHQRTGGTTALERYEEIMTVRR